MRMLIHLWMVLTLALGICGNDVVKRAAEDKITYEGSGMGSGLPVTNTDDEDYSSSSSLSVSDASYGSGDSSYGSSESIGIEDYSYTYPHEAEENNVIRMIGEFRITMISGGTLDWMPDLADSTSIGYEHMTNLITPIIQAILSAKKNTRNGLRTVKIVGFRSGSVIVDYEAMYDVDAAITADSVKKAVKDAATTQTFGDLTVDPKSVTVESISIITPTPPVDIIIPDVTSKPRKPATPQKPVKATTPRVVQTTVITTVDSGGDATSRNKEILAGKTTTQSNELGGPKTTMAPKVDPIDNNEVNDREIYIDVTPENNDMGNEMGQKHNPEPASKFLAMLFSHPAILAALVGAVVLALLTVVLLLMFVIYRIKKKDEGSYSLDEPHKVKDPMAYWKDTKEFYA